MEEVIKQVYESNFGTAYETYKEVVKTDNSVRLQDVKDYLNSLDRCKHNLNIRSIIVLLVRVPSLSLK